MMQKIQRFGGAMITPVLLFAFNGLMLGLAIACKNEFIFGSWAQEGTLWYDFWGLIEASGWTIFNHIELLFVIGLPIGLAKKAQGRAVMEAFVIYMLWNTNINYILNTWDFGISLADVENTIGLKNISGVATLDTNLFGALLISGLAVFLHNRYYDKSMPDWLGVFSGSSFVVILGFLAAIPLAFLTVIVWPPIQNLVFQAQDLIAASGTPGVGLYVFLEKILLPFGLHHFIYQPFEFGPAIVEGGLLNQWLSNMPEMSAFEGTMREFFPEGGFMMQNAIKPFFPVGIGAAFVATAKPEKRKQTLAVVIPTAATAMLVGITEPFEFTFLFLAPQLFLVHAILSAVFVMVIYSLGVSGGLVLNIGGMGIMPALFENHWVEILIYIVTGLVFIGIYYFVFKWAIEKFQLKTPGREDNEEVHMYSKKEYRAKQAEAKEGGSNKSDEDIVNRAYAYLEGLGGADNIADINNCTTRLRISVDDPDKVMDDSFFKQNKAHGVVRRGQAIQVIVGMDVPKVREAFEKEVERQGGANSDSD